jgi:hypothetical protein
VSTRDTSRFAVLSEMAEVYFLNPEVLKLVGYPAQPPFRSIPTQARAYEPGIWDFAHHSIPLKGPRRCGSSGRRSLPVELARQGAKARAHDLVEPIKVLCHAPGPKKQVVNRPVKAWRADHPRHIRRRTARANSFTPRSTSQRGAASSERYGWRW